MLLKRIFLVLVVFAFFALSGCIEQLTPNIQTCSSEGTVCGIDNKDYASECAAKDAGVNIAYKGNCVVCKDYDAGKIATDANYVMIKDKRFDDYCTDEKTLMEYYCPSNTSQEAYKEKIDCTLVADMNACKNGRCVSLNCKDADEKDIYKKGTTSLNGDIKSDHCFNTTDVVEYYCTGTTLLSEQISCPRDYECLDGACIPKCKSTVLSSKLFDFYVKDNVTKGNEIKTDYCANTTHTVEYYCENNEIKTQMAKCPTGYKCVDGACRSIACTDSDKGIDIYSVGVVSKDSSYYQDYCYDNNSVVEYSCDNNTIFSKVFKCPSKYKCTNGRCVRLENYCSESDNGKDIYSKGSTENISHNKTDYCVDNEVIKEYYCINNELISESIKCPSGYRCDNGECVSDACTDFDNGKDIYTYSYVLKSGKKSYDSCVDSKNIREMYCENNAIKIYDTTCPGNYECQNGKCVKTASACSDTDGGSEPSTKGTITVGSQTKTDYCIGYFTLLEYYCEFGMIASQEVDATNMEECYNGEIIPAQCFDPDASEGDSAYFVKTTVRRGKNLFAEDRCSGSNTLIEYTCSANYIAPVTITCDAGCYDGACKIPPIKFP